jgi:hypothetical protein
MRRGGLGDRLPAIGRPTRKPFLNGGQPPVDLLQEEVSPVQFPFHGEHHKGEDKPDHGEEKTDDAEHYHEAAENFHLIPLTPPAVS